MNKALQKILQSLELCFLTLHKL